MENYAKAYINLQKRVSEVQTQAQKIEQQRQAHKALIKEVENGNYKSVKTVKNSDGTITYKYTLNDGSTLEQTNYYRKQTTAKTATKQTTSKDAEIQTGKAGVNDSAALKLEARKSNLEFQLNNINDQLGELNSVRPKNSKEAQAVNQRKIKLQNEQKNSQKQLDSLKNNQQRSVTKK